ncbi:hypothetical protein JDV02_002201 [Purpureocillium takamizusanense]|uniref:Zn(2)-C6 fungal-type domain-containing protein n=1 Tax=Purpureocillium takamizusanense TaxID=2060973 RepID=A0A9Q8Q9S6_9HYPO|nr:uncharacterized protein JDV02_002201 [Purpureocillium takamizusanense]UNI15690.1 hypothetical protein JDV02_002201 [Purpureocillium takamizusanense]
MAEQSVRGQSPPRRMRACVPCSRSKARCNFRESNVARHLCDRCQDHGIKCVAKSTKSLRKPRQIRPLNSRLSTLERQLETLTAALEIRAGGSSLDSGAAKSENRAGVLSADQVTAALTPDSMATNSSRDGPAVNRHGGGEEAQAAAVTGPDAVPVYGLTWPQAERILDIFRTKLMPNFPFVIVQAHTTAKTLLEEKPFLFRAVMLAAAPLPPPRLAKMKRSVLAYLGQHVLVEEERKLDLLQGLLVCLAWADLRHLQDEQVTSLTYLALGYAHNLGITRMPPVLLRMIGMDEGPEDVMRSKNQAMMPQSTHSTEEQRAYLGCYCLLSVNSTQFGRQNGLKSQYIELCGNALKHNRQHALDAFLERTVRLMQMGEKISEAFGAANDCERGKPYLFLLEDQTTAFRAELDTVMDSLTQELAHERATHAHGIDERHLDSWEKAAVLHYNYLLVRLYEPATHLQELGADDGDGEGSSMAAYRAWCLGSCLDAAKAYLDMLFTLHPAYYLYYGIANSEQVTFVMVISTRLLLLPAAPGWDRFRARESLDFVAVLDRLRECLEEADAERRQDVEAFTREMGVDVSEEETAAEGRLMGTARKLRWARAWFEKKVKDGDDRTVGQRRGGSDAAAGETVAGEGEAGEEEEVQKEVVVVGRGESLEKADERARYRAIEGGSYWFGGLMPNSAWSFDDVDM